MSNNKSIVDIVREQNPYSEPQAFAELLFKRDGYNEACDAFTQQLQSTPCAGVWRKDFANVNFERAAGRHEKNGKYAYFTILKLGDNLFNIEGDHLYPAAELQERGIEYLDPTPSAEPSEDQEQLWGEISESLQYHELSEFNANAIVNNWRQHFNITRKSKDNANT